MPGIKDANLSSSSCKEKVPFHMGLGNLSQAIEPLCQMNRDSRQGISSWQGCHSKQTMLPAHLLWVVSVSETAGPRNIKYGTLLQPMLWEGDKAAS